MNDSWMTDEPQDTQYTFVKTKAIIFQDFLCVLTFPLLLLYWIQTLVIVQCNRILQLLYCITFSRKLGYLNSFSNSKNIALLQYFCKKIMQYINAFKVKVKHWKCTHYCSKGGVSWVSISIAIALLSWSITNVWLEY